MEKIEKFYPALFEVVKNDHQGMERGHNFEHALRVANVAYLVAEEPHRRLAWVAGLCHNADRILEEKFGREPNEKEVREVLDGWLDLENFGDENKAIIIEAVLRHSWPNEDDDGSILIALKDADRIVNLDPDNLVRFGQFQPDLPVSDNHFFNLFEDGRPRGKYGSRPTVVEDLWDCLDWGRECPFGVRLPKSKEMIRGRTEYLRNFFSEMRKRLIEEGFVN